MQDGIADGHNPAGDPIVTYLHGQIVHVIWPTADQSLCHGEYDSLGRMRGCYTNWHLPADTTPGLKTVWGPGATGHDFLTVFLANHEEARSLTCGGARTELKRVGEIKIPGDTSLAVYTYVTPWWPDGTLQAEVLRENGPATEQVSLGSAFTAVQRDWMRACDFRAISHP